MKTHTLKTVQPYFDKVWDGLKNFELRKNDRDFQSGDTLILKEYDPENGNYSGRVIIAGVDYFLTDCPGLEAGHCVMGIFVEKRILKGGPTC